MLVDYKILEIDNDESNFVNGSSLQGHITESYYNLIDVFGEPTYTTASGDDKVHTEWVLRFKCIEKDATDPDDWEIIYATIYDWKEAGPQVARQASTYRWNIGGNSYMADDVVAKAIEEHFSRNG
jgi:hypothetical protein